MSKERQDLIILNLDKISPSAWEEIKKCLTVTSDVTNFPDEYFKRLDDLYEEFVQLLSQEIQTAVLKERQRAIDLLGEICPELEESLNKINDTKDVV